MIIEPGDKVHVVYLVYFEQSACQVLPWRGDGIQGGTLLSERLSKRKSKCIPDPVLSH